MADLDTKWITTSLAVIIQRVNRGSVLRVVTKCPFICIVLDLICALLTVTRREKDPRGRRNFEVKRKKRPGAFLSHTGLKDQN